MVCVVITSPWANTAPEKQAIIKAANRTGVHRIGTRV
jgi:hypothetical protein